MHAVCMMSSYMTYKQDNTPYRIKLLYMFTNTTMQIDDVSMMCVVVCGDTSVNLHEGLTQQMFLPPRNL